MHFPRASLQPITTLGRLPWSQLPCLATGHRFYLRLSHGCGSEVSDTQNLEMGAGGATGEISSSVSPLLFTRPLTTCVLPVCY